MRLWGKKKKNCGEREGEKREEEKKRKGKPPFENLNVAIEMD